MKYKIMLVSFTLLFQSCVSFKIIENTYFLNNSEVHTEGDQSVSGSEVDSKLKAALK